MSIINTTEPLVPWQISPGGTFDVVNTDVLIALQHIVSIIMTTPGERVMEPNYGTDSINYIFEPNDETSQAQLISEITTQVNLWEPSITINSAVVEITNNPGVMLLNVQFSLNSTGATYTAQLVTGPTLFGVAAL
jgi:phage baseplate assembly protein W